MAHQPQGTPMHTSPTTVQTLTQRIRAIAFHLGPAIAFAGVVGVLLADTLGSTPVLATAFATFAVGVASTVVATLTLPAETY